MEGYNRREEIHFCVRNPYASQWHLIPFLGFKVVCYNVIIGYKVMITSNGLPPGKSAAKIYLYQENSGSNTVEY